MSHELLVIGGGLAGSTLAGRLARAGREVLLLERTTAPHDTMCGDFLSKEALHYLTRSSVDLAVLGAVAMTSVRLVGREILAETPLPFRALSLRRRVLDEFLLQQAMRDGVRVRRGVRVQSLARQGSNHVAQLDDAASIPASALFLATGKHDLQGQPRKGGWQNDLVAFKMYFKLSPSQQEALSGTIELILFPGGYAGLQPVDGDLANLCLLVTRSRLRECGGSWPKLIEHMTEHSTHLAQRLEGATAMLVRPLAITSIPYGFLAPSPVAGLWPLGDQAAVIPSFSGDGMSIALHSAHLAADLYLAGEPSSALTDRMRGDLRTGITLATAISQLLVRLPGAAGFVRWSPSVVRHIAIATRIPQSALLTG